MPPLPSPARGWRRLAAQARLTRGRWSWRAAVGSAYRHVLEDGGFPEGQSPVALLVESGRVSPAPDAPWPHWFDNPGVWSWPLEHRLPDAEVRAWAAAWRAHPRGAVRLTQALDASIHGGRVAAVEALLAAGAVPSPAGEGHEGLMGQLWGGHQPFPERLAIAAALRAAGHAPDDWATWAAHWGKPGRLPGPGRLTVPDLEQWTASSVPLPTGEAALRHALEWVACPPMDGDDTFGPDEAIAAVAWWRAHGALPPHADTELLSTWLDTADHDGRGDDRDAVHAWLSALIPGPLPARPAQGPIWRHLGRTPEPAVPWSHWVMHHPACEDLPSTWLDRLFDEPDAWTARNSGGETAEDLAHRLARQSRKRDLGNFLAGLRRRRHRQRLEEALDIPAPVAVVRPRL